MFESMVAIVPEGESGEARVEHFEVDKHASQMSAFRRGDYVPEGKYVRLYVGGSLYMSDTQMEKNTNWEFCRNASGDVLIAGLGIGLVLVPVLKKENVRSVTVIEKSQDVIDLISPQFQDKRLNIICADIFEWKPENGTKYDSIYFDIWPDICTDNLEQISKLHNRFKFHLNRSNPDAFMNSWQRDYLKYLKRQERSYRYAW